MAQVKLIDDWKTVAKRAWSFRLGLIAALASALDAGWSYYMTGQTPVMSLIGVAISLGASVARIIAQPSMSAD